MAFEIRSSYVDSQSRGAGEIKILKKGSPEWEEAAKDAQAILDTMDERKTRTSNGGLLTYLNEGECRFCKREFKFSVNPNTPHKKPCCSDECKEAERKVAKGKCVSCRKPHTGPDPFCSDECIKAWRRRHQRCLTCQSRTRVGQDYCCLECEPKCRKDPPNPCWGLEYIPCKTDPPERCETRLKRRKKESPKCSWFATCDNCGKNFFARSSRFRFCCVECRNIWNNKDRTRKRQEENQRTVECALEGCSKTFKGGHSQFYCSKECSKESRRRQVRKRRGAEVIIEVGETQCERCSKKFIPLPQVRNKARWCSKECSHADMLDEKRRKREELWANLECRLCGASFSATPPTTGRKKPPMFCCPECRRDSYQIQAIRNRARSRRAMREKEQS